MLTTQGKGIYAMAESTNFSNKFKQHVICGINTFKVNIRTCCGNEKLAGSLGPGMISKGKPAAI